MMREWLNQWRRRKFTAMLRPGKLVRSRYEIVQPIGEGSYGCAYLCRDIAASRRLCVLKHIQPLRGGKKRAKAVFQLEAPMLNRLRHPSVPGLIEAFRYRGAFFVAMEYVPGKSLETLLFEENRVFTEHESLLVLGKLLDVVGEVHRRGLVHRDIRIGNVILDGERLGLIDFGLARELKPGQDAVPDDVTDEDPMEKRLRRRIHVTSDFYAMGHLLLFLLYSAYPDHEEQSERSWEEELARLHPQTKKLLRRLLLTEQPYASIAEVALDVESALKACAESD